MEFRYASNWVAYAAASAMDLGESGTLPNLSFEVLGLLPFGAGITDAEPSAIIADILGNQFYVLGGVVIPGDLTQYRNFGTANGIFVLARIKDCGRLSRKEQAPASVSTEACL
jgi:hypothetical protein